MDLLADDRGRYSLLQYNHELYMLIVCWGGPQAILNDDIFIKFNTEEGSLFNLKNNDFLDEFAKRIAGEVEVKRSVIDGKSNYAFLHPRNIENKQLKSEALDAAYRKYQN